MSKMNHFLNMIFIVLLLPAVAASAQEKAEATTEHAVRERLLTEPDLVRIQRDLASTKHLQVDFKIQRKSGYISSALSKSGKANFEKPNKFIWQVSSGKKPSKKYFDGKNLWVHYYKHNRADLMRPKGEMYRLISQISDAVLSPKNLLKRFDLDSRQSKIKGTTATMRLVPKKKSEEFKSVVLTVRTDLKFVKSIKLVYREEDPAKKIKEKSTLIAFSNVLRKGKNSKIFAFQPPKGTKVNKLN